MSARTRSAYWRTLAIAWSLAACCVAAGAAPWTEIPRSQWKGMLDADVPALSRKAAAAVALPAKDAKGLLAASEGAQPPGLYEIRLTLRPSHVADAIAFNAGVRVGIDDLPAGEFAGQFFARPHQPETRVVPAVHAASGPLAKRYDVVAIGVDYLQSGDKPTDPAPYDFGCFQACDVLRALYYVIRSFDDRKVAFDRTRIYATGGSGGGNVSLMAAKFAPQTFACVVDLSGMASLTDDIAYNLPNGSSLNARYSRDPASPAHLSPGMQEIRDPGNPAHLALPLVPRNVATFVCVHGRDDTACLWEDKERVVNAMRKAGLNATLHTINKTDIDGAVIRDSGHSLGNRTDLVERFARQYLTTGSPDLRRLQGPTDFERRSVLKFPVSGGAWVVSFSDGWPELTCLAGKAPAP